MLSLLLVATPAKASEPTGSEQRDTIVVAVDSTAVEEMTQQLAENLGGEKKRKIHFINGFGIGADILGLVQKVGSSDWTNMEAMARVNILERYFPIFELGIGEADHEGRDLDNRFRVRAPYFRVGMDYNFRAQQADGNRLLFGFRYGFSTYKYDLDSAVPLRDPVWKTEQQFVLHDLSGNAHWLELVFGLETRLWTIVRLGWDLRVKFLINQKAHEVGEPWLIPGFGKKPDGIGWGGSFKLMFDI
ncbi:MAG: DUF6048 family protein [Bacteroidaceae bacterium]|nr:DUF6048 family protein [Bacteroidaceae bacterium]